MPNLPAARLLIVDDEQAQMRALCNTLRDQGYATTGFSSASEALNALENTPFDLLLTDLMMPEMNGIELLDRAHKLDSNLMGIVMTGQGSIDSAVQAMKAGALDYILKPFKLSVILPVLSRALAVRKLRLENQVLERRVIERSTQLEAANRELEAFSFSVSHDLRAPLRHIRGYLHILTSGEHGSLDPEGRQFLEKACESAARMERLIADLLDFARMGRAELSCAEFSSDELVKEVLGDINLDTQARDIRWEIAPLPRVFADRAMLKQVWTNLLANAVKYSRNRRPAVIQIASRTLPAELQFSVCDNGVGFDMEYAEKLFGVFQRLHGAEFEGTGVGLATVRRIVTRHGGRIWAEAKPDQGATFYFTVPRYGQNLAQSAAAAEPNLSESRQSDVGP